MEMGAGAARVMMGPAGARVVEVVDPIRAVGAAQSPTPMMHPSLQLIHPRRHRRRLLLHLQVQLPQNLLLKVGGAKGSQAPTGGEARAAGDAAVAGVRDRLLEVKRYLQLVIVKQASGRDV